MKTRFISAQVLLNKDMTMKAQRVYSIPMPSVVSVYLDAHDLQGEATLVGVMVQDWKSADCLDFHPDLEKLIVVVEKHFGLNVWGIHNDK